MCKRGNGHSCDSEGNPWEWEVWCDLVVVAHTLPDFAKGMEAVAEYLCMMGMELNPRKRAMAMTEGVLGVYLRACPHLANP